MNVIETTHLGKRYRRSWALRDCTLAIPAGHVVALVGPNGAERPPCRTYSCPAGPMTSGFLLRHKRDGHQDSTEVERCARSRWSSS